MPYKNRQKQLKYVSDWQKRKHPRKYPNGKPKILTADMVSYRKAWKEKNKKIVFRTCQYCEKEFKKTNFSRKYCSRECYNTYYRESSERYFKIILNHYGWKCNCCPETGILFLTVDHVNNDGNKDVAVKGYRLTGLPLYKKVIDEGFPNKYQIFCFNCNLGKHRNGGTCPHNIK